MSQFQKSFLKSFSAVLFFALFSAACSRAASYNADLSKIVVEWTAFKTTEKVPVKGSFAKFQVSGKNSAANLSELLQGLKIDIDATSVQTGNPARDATLGQYFFGLLLPSPQITAAVSKVTGDDQKGNMTLKIEMNGMARDIVFPYTADAQGNFQAQATLNLMEFNLKTPFESLHQACEQLHTGKDGVSKTWEEVALTVKGQFQKSGM